MFGVGIPKVTPGQKVGANQKEEATKKPFSISWDKTTAKKGETVKITATAKNVVIKNKSMVTINILFNGQQHAVAEKITVNQNQVNAEWTVSPRNVGDFTAGFYDAEIKYNNGVPSKTNPSLRVVSIIQGGGSWG